MISRLQDVARSAGFPEELVEPFGTHKAKLSLSPLKEERTRTGRYILVAGMTPTALGEGKTTTTIGLSMALCQLGKKAVATVRQPSMGPVFGIKGGGTGGGKARLVPDDEINLHLTGDFHAVAAANNLLAAHVDTQLLLENPLGLDGSTVTWRRVVDVNDRALRSIVIGLGGSKNGIPRETGFDIVPASEVMAILGLSSGLSDLRTRLGRIVVGQDRDGQPVTAEKLRCAGAMAATLRDAIRPNMVATSEGTAALVHTGPFADIAHGSSSIVADKLALRFADYVVTESGFGADMGAEKFFNLKCRISGETPDAAVLVTTIRAIKMHGGGYKVTSKKHDPRLDQVDPETVSKGCDNVEAHIGVIRRHGIPVVVAVNRMPGDDDAEIDVVRQRALAAGAHAVEVSDAFAKGGQGALDLARAVEDASALSSSFEFLYPEDATFKEKIETITDQIYGADHVSYAQGVAGKLRRFAEWGLERAPVCMAKTPMSLSSDPARLNRPSGFEFPVTEVRAYMGAGFVCALSGTRSTMPGLSSRPRLVDVDIDDQGKVIGL